MTFSVMTINVRHDKDFWEERFELIADEIARLGPDLIGLQEVMVRDGQSGVLLDLIKKRTGGEPGYEMVEKLKTGFNSIEGEGIAIFSRHPIERKAYADLEYGRPALFARVKAAPELTVDIIDTHLHHRGGDALKLWQAKKLVRFADKKNAGHITFLTGDMNSKPMSGAIKHFRENSFVDTYFEFHGEQKTIEDGGTSPVILSKDNVPQNPARRIDYVFYRPAGKDGPRIRITGSEVCFKNHNKEGLYPSDHLGIMTTFEISY